MIYLVSIFVFLVANVWSSYFYQPFVYPKSFFVDIAITIAAMTLVFAKKLKVPTQPMMILVFGLIITRLIATIFNFNDVAIAKLISAGGFAVLTFYFVSNQEKLDLKKLFYPFIIGSLAVTFQSLFIAPPIGNINIVSEYLILLFPLSFYYCRVTEGFRRILAVVATLGWLGLILYLQSRSVWLGLGLCLLYEFRGRKKLLAGGFVLLMVGFISYNLTTKKHSTGYRYDVYKSSLKMVADNPVGLGGGGFEYSYVPYQYKNKEGPREKEIYSTPHSEFLKWGIEQGWAYLVCSLFFWLILAFYIFEKATTPPLRSLYVCLYLVMLPQLFFQFPFENPASFIALAFSLGIISRQVPTEEVKNPFYFKALLILFTAAFVFYSTGKSMARWLESQHQGRLSHLSAGCKFDPSNWRVCFLYSMYSIAVNDFDGALNSIKRSITNRPFDYHALRALVFYYSGTGQHDKGCQVAKVYSTMLTDTQMFEPYIRERCSEIPNPIQYTNPRQYREDYLRWIGLKE